MVKKTGNIVDPGIELNEIVGITSPVLTLLQRKKAVYPANTLFILVTGMILLFL